ncbi:neutral/alkaline non-lysosomal ceramidase N-terminal domain-containing protein [Myxococcota bacterium]|nr:neutral/alkaline non-lysosomal ceramidase N-terminal domain-containing protein [Myxococcota bacterium]
MSPLRPALALAALTLGACVAPLDRRPLHSTHAYATAVDAIDRAIPGALVARGRLLAGWARTPIDVPPGAPLAGYGDREGAAHLGVRDPVQVRAFAFSAGDRRAAADPGDAGSATTGSGTGSWPVGQGADPTRAVVVVFTADLLLVPPIVAEQVRAALREVVAPEQLFFTATHTHSGPGGFAPGLIWELVFGPYDPRSADAVVRAHVDAAKRAIAELAPAKIGSAEVAVPGLVMNRVERHGPTDEHLFVLRIEKDDGRRAALWSFGCHAVTLPSSNLALSADYPGELARALEGSDVELVGFAAGGVGSSNPRYERPETRWLVEPLLRAVRAGLDEAKRNARATGTVAARSLSVPLPPARYRVERELMVWPVAIESLVEVRELDFGAVAIGDTVLAHVPGELSGELTRAARANARANGVHLAVLPFDGSYAGYVVPHRVYDLPDDRGEEMLHYETHTLAFFGPHGADLMMSLAMRLAIGVHGVAKTSWVGAEEP